MKLPWTEFRTLIDSKQIRYKYIERASYYLLLGFDGQFQVECQLDKSPSDSTDLDEFEASYKVNQRGLLETTPAGVTEPNNYRARMKGMGNWTATAGQTTDLDYQMQQLAWQGTNKKSYFDGVEYYAEDAVIGDYVKFQVVDKDGLVYPAGTLLEEFGDTWYVVPNSPVGIRLFKSAIVPGMYIRIKYTSTGGTNVKFVGNLFRFIKTDEDA